MISSDTVDFIMALAMAGLLWMFCSTIADILDHTKGLYK